MTWGWGLPLARQESNERGRPGQDGPAAERTHISVCNYIFPTSPVVLVTWGLGKAFITFQLSDFFPPFLLPSDFEISSVTHPFDFLLIPGPCVLSVYSPSCFSKALLVLELF